MHRAIVVTDLSFGDAGKGSITDALVRRGAGLVVRFNGGAQAAHTVVELGGRSHIFHQFGSGTLVEGTETFLSRFVMVNPLALFDEAEKLRAIGVSDAFERTHVDARALVTTPFQVAANRLREVARGAHRHGSCGMGIGETAADALNSPDKVLRFGDLRGGPLLRHKLKWHRDSKRREMDALALQLQGVPGEQTASLLNLLHSEEELDAAVEVFALVAEQVEVEAVGFLAQRMTAPGCTVFEGAQGVLLDEEFGFHPHTTWSKTTSANARTLIGEAGGKVQTTVLGLCRAYATRHGAGPFPTEEEQLTRVLREPHNPTNQWQGPFRAGWLDLPLLRYAMRVNGGIDGLVVTCLDRLQELEEARVGLSYSLDSSPWEPEAGLLSLVQREQEGRTLCEIKVRFALLACEAENYASALCRLLEVPLLGTSCGMCAENKTWMF